MIFYILQIFLFQSKSGLDEDDDSDDFFATDSDESSSDDELPEGGRKQWGAWMFLKDTT